MTQNPMAFILNQQIQPVQVELPKSWNQKDDTAEETGGEAGNGSVAASTSSKDTQPAGVMTPIAFAVNVRNLDEMVHESGQPNSAAISGTAVASLAAADADQSSRGGSSDSSSADEHPQRGSRAELARAASYQTASTLHENSQTVTNPTAVAAYSANEANPARAVERNAPASKPSAIPDEEKMPVAPAPRHIDVRLPNDDGAPVDVRISQRAGEVQMTVRTLDGDLSQSLRKHLPELSANLTQGGLKSDFLHSSVNQPSETAQGGNQQQYQQNQENQRQSEQETPTKKHSGKDQASGSFAQLIDSEKGNK